MFPCYHIPFVGLAGLEMEPLLGLTQTLHAV